MLIGGVDFDEGCPDDCPGKEEFKTHMQGGMCHRCPIFNCTGDFRLMEPEEYREDWAVEWRRWFDGGKDGRPSLPLVKGG